MILRRFFRFLRFLTIRQKLILTICGCTLLAVIVTSSIILGQAAGVIDRELINQGTIVATNLCKQSTEPILHVGYWEVYKNVKTVTTGTYLPFMKYIVIQDRQAESLPILSPCISDSANACRTGRSRRRLTKRRRPLCSQECSQSVKGCMTSQCPAG